MRSIITILILLFTTSFCYANWGGTNFGGQQFGSGKWGVSAELPSTYWFTSYTETGDWDTAYGLDWDVAYNTEVP